MKQMIKTIALAALVATHPLYGADDADNTDQTQKAAVQKEAPSFWESIRKKIETFTPKKKLTSTNAVGGVRGAQVDTDDLYWKGEAIITEIDVAELELFKNALTLFEAGNKKDATNAFEQFIGEYPKSTLAADAKEALGILQTQ